MLDTLIKLSKYLFDRQAKADAMKRSTATLDANILEYREAAGSF